MAKKKQHIQLVGLDDLNFGKEPDIKSAESVVKPVTEVKKEPVVEKVIKAPKPVEKPKAKKASTPKIAKLISPSKKEVKGTLPPANKKRASFNIDEDLHRALKDFSYFEEIDMVEYIFENLVKKDLAKKGYYPPKKRK